MNTSPKVVIIVLNWNGCDDTLECLRSLEAVDYPNYDYEVIVVDNMSTGEDARVIEAKYGQWIHIIKNDRNYGFAEGNNIGIRYALGRGAEYVLLLNNDTIVAPDFLLRLVGVAQSDDSIGILNPTIYYYNAPTQVQYQGRKISWYGPPPPMIKPRSQEEQAVDIEAASGACMLIKRKVIERVGFFCSEYFYQVEDTDYCARALRQGFRVVCVPQASIWHKGSVSLNKVPANKLGYFTRNRFIFRTKYATTFQLTVFIVWFFLIEAPMNLVYYLSRFRDFSIAKGLLWGLKEGLTYLVTHRRKYVHQGVTPHDESQTEITP